MEWRAEMVRIRVDGPGFDPAAARADHLARLADLLGGRICTIGLPGELPQSQVCATSSALHLLWQDNCGVGGSVAESPLRALWPRGQA